MSVWECSTISSRRQLPFALNYGVMAQYVLTSRLRLTLELGGKTTFSDFDGFGKSNSFGGDNILSFSAGLSFTLGKNGFRKVINAKPVLIDNARLRETLADIYGENLYLSRQTANDARVLAELKKILEIEGLLSRYVGLFNSKADDEGTSSMRFPVNDYSGLNSLRARLKGFHVQNHKEESSDTSMSGFPDDEIDLIDRLFPEEANGDSISTPDNNFSKVTTDNGISESSGSVNSNVGINTNEDSMEYSGVHSHNDYISLLSSGKKCIGSPILFFLKLGTSDLTDNSQMTNLDEIARVAKAYGLHIRVTGAADSATGTTGINKDLGDSRANFISSQLQKRGINSSLITKINKGGIDLLEPDEANRHCKVELFLLP